MTQAFHICLNIPAGGSPSRFASFTQNGETRDLRRKALDLKSARKGKGPSGPFQ